MPVDHPIPHGVVFIGPIHSGKTATSEWLINNHTPLTEAKKRIVEYDFHKFSFADAVRQEVVTACYPFDIDKQHDALAEMHDLILKEQWRPILQFWGTELRRRHDHQPDYWVDKLRMSIGTAGLRFDHSTASMPHMHRHLFVIDDCRYANEYYMLKQLGCMFIGLDPHPEFPPPDRPEHESEEFWRNVPFVDMQMGWMSIQARGKSILKTLSDRIGTGIEAQS